MDYRELNEHVNAYSANTDVCAQTMREWRQQGPKAAIVDLRRAYLQIHVDKSLWPFQTVEIKGQRYCPTRLGFGLNVAPQIMRSIVKAVIGQDETVSRATSSYVDDIFVNESVCSVAQVKTHLERFGLTCKNPEQLSSGTRVLGVYIWEERGKLRWRRDGTTKHKTPCCVGCLTKLWWDRHKLIQHVVTGARMVRKSLCGWMPAPWPLGWLFNMTEPSLKTQVGYDRCTSTHQPGGAWRSVEGH